MYVSSFSTVVATFVMLLSTGISELSSGSVRVDNSTISNASFNSIPSNHSISTPDIALPHNTVLRLGRIRRDDVLAKNEVSKKKQSDDSNFEADEVGWSVINEEVDMMIPMILKHLQELEVEFLHLPDISERISISPLFMTYEAGLYLTNGIAYNLGGVQRTGDAYMTYEDKSFLTKFNLIVKSLQFEYDFVIKLVAVEGHGQVIGTLDDTTIHGELAVLIPSARLKLKDFRITKFSNIQVELNQSHLVRQLTGVVLSPITNLFKDEITTSISDGLKDQMQELMDDFNNEDPLGLHNFTQHMLAGLTGQTLGNTS